MVYDTPEQEKQAANEIIADRMQEKQNYIDGAMATVKNAKKELRKLTKQANCEHDFKWKMTPLSDHYKCKKCKFEFFSDVEKATVKNRIIEGVKFDGLYDQTDDDAPQAQVSRD